MSKEDGERGDFLIQVLISFLLYHSFIRPAASFGSTKTTEDGGRGMGENTLRFIRVHFVTQTDPFTIDNVVQSAKNHCVLFSSSPLSSPMGLSSTLFPNWNRRRD